MSHPPRTERETKIRERLSAISPTPWCLDERMPAKVFCDDSLGSMVAECASNYTLAIDSKHERDNAAFIANAPADLEWALSQLDSVRAALAEESARLDFLEKQARDDGDLTVGWRCADSDYNEFSGEHFSWPESFYCRIEDQDGQPFFSLREAIDSAVSEPSVAGSVSPEQKGEK